MDAHNRKVSIIVILDKSQIKNNKYFSDNFLINKGIETYIDYQPSIAHNKVMIIDGHEVITGSFNFTKAAQQHNVEDLLII